LSFRYLILINKKIIWIMHYPTRKLLSNPTQYCNEWLVYWTQSGLHPNHCIFKSNDPGGDLSTEGGAMTVLVGGRTLRCSKGVKLVETWSIGQREESLKLSRANLKEWGERTPLERKNGSKKMDEKTVIGES
jgi:hypothetical protein